MIHRLTPESHTYFGTQLAHRIGIDFVRIGRHRVTAVKTTQKRRQNSNLLCDAIDVSRQAVRAWDLLFKTLYVLWRSRWRLWRLD